MKNKIDELKEKMIVLEEELSVKRNEIADLKSKLVIAEEEEQKMVVALYVNFMCALEEKGREEEDTGCAVLCPGADIPSE